MDGAVLKLDPFTVQPFAEQPRKRFAGIDNLLASILAVGQSTPILVTRNMDGVEPQRSEGQNCGGRAGYFYRLIDGERRLRACRKGKIPVLAYVADAVTESDRFVRSIAANFCRQDHDAIEISDALVRMRAAGMSQEKISAVFGKSRSWVAQHMSLAHLSPEVREDLKRNIDQKVRGARGRLSFSLAVLLTPLVHEQQGEVLRHIQKKQLSLAAARNYIASFMLDESLRKLVRPGAKLARVRSPSERISSLASAFEHLAALTKRYTAEEISAYPASRRSEIRSHATTIINQLRELLPDLDCTGCKQGSKAVRLQGCEHGPS